MYGRLAPAGAIFLRSDQHAVAVVDLVLDDLGRPALKILYPGLEMLRLPPDLDLLVPGAFAGTAQQGQAALFRLVGALLFQNFRVEHGAVAGSLLKDDDALCNADHIRRHAHTAFPVVQQCVHQVPGGVQVVLCGRGGLPGQQEGVVYQLFYHRINPPKYHEKWRPISRPT